MSITSLEMGEDISAPVVLILPTQRYVFCFESKIFFASILEFFFLEETSKRNKER